MDTNTASLRVSAPQWTLAGDKQLLDILQNIHQSLVTRCQEVNRKLDEMVLALDGASVDLQNVNNKFMALSNSQFIESRVYDDDIDVAAQETPKETPKPSDDPPSRELQKLKNSIRVLESSHEIIEILDSDSDDEDDDEGARTVLKPKDMYWHRPLPFIIGSQPWRNKWHAGLHPSDSDSDSSGFKPDEDQDQYSDEEPKPDVTRSQARAETLPRDTEESTTSSELPSEQDSNVGSLPTAGKPSDIAAELARRLGGNLAKIPVQEPDYSPPKASSTKVYRPDKPSVGTVFCDEPPPLPPSDDDPPSEDDIFAELHKSKPYEHSSKDQSRLAEDLFSGLEGEGDIFSDFREDKVTSTPAPKKTTLFEDEPEPELFTAPTKPHEGEKETSSRPTAEPVKKPIGGISLFGNNKGAESIGAAILKRHQRQSSDESDVTPQTKEVTPPKNKEKDIFDDLFAKSEREQKKTQKKREETPKKEVPKETAKVDLFSDNIFDDIDDIFTSNITVSKKEKKDEKPLFDDDDDLFSDIAVAKDSKQAKSRKEKSIFDSDDDLFTDDVKKTETIKPSEETKHIPKENHNRFENVDDIFSDIVESKDVETKSNVVNVVPEEITRTRVSVDRIVPESKITDVLVSGNDSVFDNDDKQSRGPNNNMEKSSTSIFEDDDELFAKTTKKVSSSDENSNIVNDSLKKAKSDDNSLKSYQKTSLFNDDSDENDLFGASTKKPQGNNKNNVNYKKPSNKNANDLSKNENNVQKSIFDDDEKDDYIFATSSKESNMPYKSETAKQTENNKKSKPNNKSLFTSSDEDDLSGDSNLFSKISNKPAVQQKPTEIDQTHLVKPETLLKEEQKPTVDEQKPSDSQQKPSVLQKPRVQSEKPSPKIQIDEQKSRQGLSGDEKISAKEQKPIVNDQKPTLQQKPKVKQEKSQMSEVKQTIVEQKPDILKDNLNSELDKEPQIVDSKNTLHEDNKKEELATVPREDPLLKLTLDVNAKIDLKQEPIEYKIPDLDQIESIDNTEVNEPLFSEPKDTLLNSPAVFDDIFREPPAFEKSSEPKKSKNVNALFDDDSDDEALFFKKNDVIVDEKPDLSPDSNKDALFGIFHDEPPAIEVDFTQKASKSNINDDFLKSDSDDDMFTMKSKKQPTPQRSQKYIVPDDSNTKENKSQMEVAKPLPVLDKAELFEQKSKSEVKSSKDSTDSDTKKIGKLKSMNFNIDVSTLLPGASPKRKTFEQTDGQVLSSNNDNLDKDLPKNTDTQILSTKSHEDLHTKDKIEHSVLKSVSFDGEPDATILDNKLSKERARIQVKRRPSTRRARKEAVKKSAIDQDDSTDNSNSFDDAKSPKSQPASETRHNHAPEKTVEDKSKEFETPKVPKTISTPESSKLHSTDVEINRAKSEIKTKSKSNKESIDTTDSKHINMEPSELSSPINPSPSQTIKMELDLTTADNNKHTETAEIKSNTVSDASISSNAEIEPKNQNVPEAKRSDSKNVTSKVVYILNDEDIFSNPIEKKSKVLNIVDDDNDDDLFKNISRNTDPIPSISTLGDAYRDIATEIEKEVISTIGKQSEIDKQSKLDDNSTLFKDNHKKSLLNEESSNKVDRVTDSTVSSKSNISNKDTKTKKSLFDDLSDDENELFNPTKKATTKSKNILDSDSEEDLFGGRKKETKVMSKTSGKEIKDSNKASAKEIKEVPKAEVKSSLFGDDDDDDDLFGVKVKSNVVSTPQPTRVAKEPLSKTPEPVFDDPLSLLGADDD